MKGKMTKYHYTQSGLPNIWIWCRCVVDNAGNRTAIIPNVKGLHQAIADSVVNSNGALTGPEIKFLRTEMGMTQADFGELIHRERLTVSRWERGEAAPDGALDTLIRILASKKLELEEIDPEEIAGKFLSTKQPKDQINIEITNSKHYRLAA